MPSLFPNIQINVLSFWIGFAAATLFWWILQRVIRLWPQILQYIKDQIEIAKKRNLVGIEERLRRETLRYVQGLHLAAPLFSLDEIVIPPSFLAPPPQIDLEEGLPVEDTASAVIPFLPDWPEFVSNYNVPKLTLAEALSSVPRVVVIGQPGSGKTVALADFISRLLRHQLPECSAADLVPLYLHIGDLPLTVEAGKDPLTQVISVVNASASVMALPQMPGFLRASALSGRLLLVIDGADEYQASIMQSLSAYLMSLRQAYPDIHLIVTAAPDTVGQLVGMKFAPVAIAGWNAAQRAQFIEKWGSAWQKQIEPMVTKDGSLPAADPLLLNSWLIGEDQPLSPLALTLKIWSLYAGDIQGSCGIDGIKAYLQRAIPDARLLPAVQALALQIVLSGSPTIFKSKISTFAEQVQLLEQDMAEGKPVEEKAGANNKTVKAEDKKQIAVQSKVNSLLASGLLEERLDGSLGFAHTAFLGYLASQAIKETDPVSNLVELPAWPGRDLMLKYLAARSDIFGLVDALLSQDEDDIFQKNLMSVARWLPEAPTNMRWRSPIMRGLLEILQRESLPLTLRARPMAAFAASNDPSISVLLHQLITSPSPVVRQLAALGCGAVREAKAINDLVGLLGDPEPTVRYAACMAMVAIGSTKAVDIIWQVMTQGDEDLSRVSAEALAGRPDYGYALLQDGCVNDNLMVRRAVVQGLVKIPERWATDILEKLRVEDGQWVVRNAAAQAIEDMQRPNPYLPHHLKAPHDTPWLVALASRQGIGISPDQPVNHLLADAIHSDNPEEKLAALSYLRTNIDPDLTSDLLKMVYSETGAIREAAAYTLWWWMSGGIPIPSPTAYGLH